MTDNVNAHARLSPSSSERWMNCPGSVRLVGDREEVSNSYMREGTAAHEIAAAVLKYGNVSALQTTHVDVEGQRVEVTDEMRSAVTTYVDYVFHLQRLHSGALFVEQRVDLTPLGLPEPVFGTSDAILISDHHGVLDVVDLKYGQGVVVRASENPQLMMYVVGALLFATGGNLVRALDKYSSITVHIVQPRAPSVDGPIRSWEIHRGDVLAFVQRFVPAVEDTRNPDAPLVPGEHCRFCPVRASCPALKKHAESVALVELSQRDPEPMPSELLTTEQVADLLRKVPIIETWIAALRQRIEAELRAGRPVPGWKLVAKRATRQWKDPAELIEWATAAGVEVYSNPEMKSPAQVEKDVGKKNLPAELYESKSSGETLVPESDPRPEVSALPPAEETANRLYLMRGDE